MTDIKWEDPTPSMHGQHDEFAAALREHPGKWAVFSEDASNTTAAQISKGLYAAFRPAGAFEAKSRSNGTPRRGRIFARYIGENGEHA